MRECNAACGKVAYASKAEAVRFAGVIRRHRNHKGLRPYVCPDCGKFHLTHRSKQIERREQRPREVVSA